MFNKKSKITLLNYLLLAFGFLTTSIIIFDNAIFESGFEIVVLGFWAWTIIPYLILVFTNKYFTKTIIGKVLVLSAVVVSVFGGLYIYHQGFYVNLDAQNALLFIFIPVFQDVLAVIVFIIAGVLQLALKKGKNEG